ncbi:MAG: hypothetical protein AAGJ34_00655 [Pseudomonadota bacterium]
MLTVLIGTKSASVHFKDKLLTPDDAFNISNLALHNPTLSRDGRTEKLI